MWQRKSDNEIEQIKLQHLKSLKSPKWPLIGSLLFTIAIGIFKSLGFVALGSKFIIMEQRKSLFIENFIAISPLLFVFFIISFIITYSYRLIFKKPFSGSTDTLLCNLCKVPSQNINNGVCICGGKLEPFDYFDFVDDEKQTINNSIQK